MLTESATNPRRRYDHMEQLAENVKLHGILEPLLVRPTQGGTYEIVAGGRRYRAAKTAGLAVVPVHIRALSDEQVLEFHLVENLQRDDLHPLDEAAGYRQLATCGYTLEKIAGQIHKSEAYICQRLKLAELAPPLQQAFLARKITVSHALHIARLQPPDQLRALKWIESDRRAPGTVRELVDWIHSEIYLDLQSGMFPKNDPQLLPEAGTCQACPKRAGNNRRLFPDLKKADTCTDPACFQLKLEAYIQRELRAAETQGKKLQRVSTDYHHEHYQKQPTPGVLYRKDYTEIDSHTKACPSAEPAIVTEGYTGQGGRLLTICRDKQCKTHGRSGYPTAQDLAAQRKAKQQARIKAGTTERILAAVLERVKIPFEAPDLRMLATALFRETWTETRKRICQRNQIEPHARKELAGYKDYEAGFAKHLEGLKAPALYRLLFEILLVREGQRYGERSLLDEAAQRYKLDGKAITQQVAAELAGKQPKDRKK